ncbi:hypothetical protein Ocin01_11011 [Orchesella cincta]|uniref:Uncharacterized protein n=1 Tax=Orchesella cincta TaxID=48709 RepID=A0A1D2MSH7_ORCCI|nr:hypothetical protein Ocin01_11011 [Orchesella cincta]
MVHVTYVCNKFYSIPRKLQRRTNPDKDDDVGVETFYLMGKFYIYQKPASINYKQENIITILWWFHLTTGEGQKDSMELLKLEGKCKVSILLDEKQSRFFCTIRTCRESKMVINDKDALCNRVKYVMPLKKHPKFEVFEADYASKSMARLDQLRKDSPPRELFRIRKHISCYDTYRFRCPIPKTKEHLRINFNLVVPDMEVTNVILNGIDNNAEEDEKEKDNHLVPI